MRTVALIFLCQFCLNGLAWAQSQKTQFSFEYSPGLLTIPSNIHDTWRPVHGAFIKPSFYLSPRFDLTTGFGYFNTRTLRIYFYSHDYTTYTHFYRNYISIPVGIKYKLKSSYVNLEIAGAFNFGNPVIYQTYLNGELTETIRGSPSSDGHPRQWSIPMFLSLGKEIPWKNNSILLGVRGSMSLLNVNYQTHNNMTFYSAGLLAGIKWGKERIDMSPENEKLKKPKKTLQADSTVQITIEYYSHKTGIRTRNSYGKWTHRGFIKADVPLDRNIYFSTGLGVITAHDNIHQLEDIFEYKDVTTFWSYHYAVLPVGIKYRYRRFSFNPEISIAYNFDNSSWHTYSDSTGYSHRVGENFFMVSSTIKNWAMLAFTTLLYEIPIGKSNLVFGVKGHISLTDINQPAGKKHFYGTGFIAALKI